MAYEFGTAGLSLKEQIYIELCHCLNVFLGVLGGSWGRNRTSRIAWCKFPYSEEFLRASRLLYLNESVAGQELEPGAIAVERNLVSSNWVSPNGLADLLGLELLELLKGYLE